MKTKISNEAVAVTIGLLTSLTLVIYFWIMKLLGLHMMLELRFFNILIMSVAVFYGVKRYKDELQEEEFYLKGLGHAMMISVVTVLSFAIFMGFYLAYFDEALMNKVRESVSMGQYIDPLTVVFVIFLEGMASSSIVSFAIMQYLKSQGTEGKKIEKHLSRDNIK